LSCVESVLFVAEAEKQLMMDKELAVVREESYDEGRIEGREEGRMEGERKGIIDTARNFLKLGIPIEDVIKATGLSKVEIANL